MKLYELSVCRTYLSTNVCQLRDYLVECPSSLCMSAQILDALCLGCSTSWVLIVRMLSVPCSMSGGSVSLSCLWWGRGVSTWMVKNSKYFKKLIIGGFPNVTENVTDEVKILWKILCLVNQIYSLNKCINHFARQSNQWLRRKNLCQYHFQFQGVSQRRFTALIEFAQRQIHQTSVFADTSFPFWLLSVWNVSWLALTKGETCIRCALE